MVADLVSISVADGDRRETLAITFVRGQGNVHTWFEPPKQSQICRRVPSAELTSVASRHLLDCGLRRVPLACACHTCAPVPLQSHSCTLVPLAVPPEVMSMHLPRACSVPLVATVQRWALVPLHVHSCTAVPLAGLAPATSTHLPPMPVICPVRVPPPPMTVSKIAVTSEVDPVVSCESSQFIMPPALAMSIATSCA